METFARAAMLPDDVTTKFHLLFSYVFFVFFFQILYLVFNFGRHTMGYKIIFPHVFLHVE